MTPERLDQLEEEARRGAINPVHQWWAHRLLEVIAYARELKEITDRDLSSVFLNFTEAVEDARKEP